MTWAQLVMQVCRSSFWVHDRSSSPTSCIGRSSSPGWGGREGGPRLVAVASGKGGVGQTNLSLNLGLAMARRTGRSDVCLVDIDFGLANADVLCSVQPERTLADVLDGRCDMEDAMVLGPGGLRLLPGIGGGRGRPSLDEQDRSRLVQLAGGLGEAASVVLFDCAAGIGRMSARLPARLMISSS